MKMPRRKSKVLVYVRPPLEEEGSEIGTPERAACGRKTSKDGILASPIVPSKEPDELEFQIWAAKNGEVMV